MKWERRPYVYCSRCRDCLIYLNEYGICADCWTEMDANARAALTGDPEKRVEVVTYTLPATPGFFKRAAVAWFGATAGGLTAMALARLAGWV